METNWRKNKNCFRLSRQHYLNYIKSLAFTLLTTMIVLASACDQKRKSIDTSGNITPKVEKQITIYGSESCDHCIEFRNKVDSLGIKYSFKDAEVNENYYREMILKVQRQDSKGNVSFPVIEIDDKIMVRPELDEFIKEFSK